LALVKRISWFYGTRVLIISTGLILTGTEPKLKLKMTVHPHKQGN